MKEQPVSSGNFWKLANMENTGGWGGESGRISTDLNGHRSTFPDSGNEPCQTEMGLLKIKSKNFDSCDARKH